MVSRRPSAALDNIQNSIWVEFTALAAQHKAVNLGQGFPDGAMPKFVCDLLHDISEHPERTDWHQYTRGYGHPRLVNILSKIYSDLYGRSVKPNEEILVTVGAYMALYYAFRAWINKGDEVLIIEPCYDCYAPQVLMSGGIPVSYRMNLKEGAKSSADYTIDLAALEAKCNKNTKMIVVNNPNNPTGKLYTKSELEGIAEIAKKYDLIVIADEVYEWHQMDKEMIRFASLPGMFDRTISVGSAGKAFSITGWKTGWAIGPDSLLNPLKKIHQNCIFTGNTPAQEAIARAFEIEYPMLAPGADKTNSYLLHGLPQELKDKRDKLAAMLEEAGLKPLIPDSGYFLIADFSKIDGPFREEKPGDDPIDFRFVRWLCKEKKLASIPPSAFFFDPSNRPNDNLIRLCFMKKYETLEAAHEILRKL